jgi:hypothetical protein
MPIPTLAQVKPVSNLITDLALSYMQADDRFVATRAVPAVPVMEESGTYMVVNQQAWQTDQSERRAYGDTYAQSGWSMGTGAYATLQYGEEFPIPDEIAASNQAPMGLEQLAASWHAEQMAIRKERQFAAAYMVGSIWGTTNTTANDWDTSTGTPVTDVLTAKRTISQATGQGGDINAVMGEIVWDALLVNAQIVARVQYVNSLTIPNMEALIASSLGISNLYVSKAIRQTANLAATATYAAIVDDDCWVYANNSGAGVLDPTAGKLLHITQHKQQWTFEVVASGMGYIFTDIV